MTFSAKQFKSLFPLFSQPENSSLVYLDNAATTQRPAVVIDAVAEFYRSSNANAHRASHRLSRRATEMLEQTRYKAAQFLGAGSSRDVVFTRGATEGLNLLAHSLTANLQPGDEIVLTAAEHHANLVPWQMAAQRLGLQLRFVPSVDGIPQLDRLGEVLTSRTRIVSVTAASNALGFITDLASLRSQLPGRDLAWVVDAAQLAAHRPVDISAIGCDFLVCSAHKFYGPTGIGLLVARRGQLDNLPPWQGGGEMIDRVTLEHSSYALAPLCFETGTPSLAAIAGLNACFDFWQGVNRKTLEQHERDLLAYLHKQLQKLTGIRLLTVPQNNVGIATFVPTADSDLSATDIATWLDNRDIAVRAGHHCAMPLMEQCASGDASIRVSLAAYNSRDDIDALVVALDECLTQTTALPLSDSRAPCAKDRLGDLSIEQLQNLNSWQSRYRQILKWADAIATKPQIRTGQNRVRGCEAATWISYSQENGHCRFYMDSDARVVKGLAAVLLLLIDHKTREDIAAVDLPGVFSQLGFEKHLSPSRNNGFRALVDRAMYLAGLATDGGKSNE